MKDPTDSGSKHNTRRIYQLGEVKIETDTLKVFREGKSYSLEPRNMALLEYLIEHSDRVVTSDELIYAIWSNRPMGESPLYKSIAAIRKALGDDTQSPRYIETISKTGYRLLQSPKSIVSTSRAGSHLLKFVVASVLVSIVIAALVIVRKLDIENPASFSEATSYAKIAILPFASDQLEVGDEYLATGLAQELTHRLSNLSQIRVISQRSLLHFNKSNLDAGQLRQLLGINFLLDGEILLIKNIILVRAFLIDTANHEQIWSAKFETNQDDMLNLHATIAEQVGLALKIKIIQEEKIELVKQDTSSREAYLAYMRGRYFWSKLQRAEVEKSLREFQRAIDIDPAYARAWSGLADSYNFLAELNAIAPETAYSKARKATQMALNLDPELAEAHAALAVILSNYDWDWRKAISHYNRAISRDPSYVPAYQAKAEILRDLGRIDEAIELIKIARQLDPLSPAPMLYEGTVYLLGRKNQLAISIYLELIKAYPEYHIAQFYLALAYSISAQPEKALDALDKVDPDGQFPDAVALRGYIYSRLGDNDRARKTLEDLDQLAPESYVSPFLKSLVHMQLGDKNKALSLLEQGYRERTWMMRLLKVIPHFDPIRNEPRFETLMEKMDLVN